MLQVLDLNTQEVKYRWKYNSWWYDITKSHSFSRETKNYSNKDAAVVFFSDISFIIPLSQFQHFDSLATPFNLST